MSKRKMSAKDKILIICALTAAAAVSGAILFFHAALLMKIIS
jgi:cell division protein FtsL